MSDRKRITIQRGAVVVHVSLPTDKGDWCGPSAAGFVGDNEQVAFALLQAEIDAAVARNRGQGRKPTATVEQLRDHIETTGADPQARHFDKEAAAALGWSVRTVQRMKKSLM